MKILHTSDWHLGKTIEAAERFDEQRAVCSEICSIAAEHDIDLVIIAGDIFDSYNPPIEAEKIFFETVTELSAGGSRAVVIIAGNHDSPERLNSPFQLAYKNSIYICGFPKDKLPVNTMVSEKSGGTSVIESDEGFAKIHIEKCNETVSVITLAYPSESRFKENYIKSSDEKSIDEDYKKQVREWLKLKAEKFSPDTVNIIAGHIYFAGGVITEERAVIGGESPLCSLDLPQNLQYAALGHIHRPQSFLKGKFPIAYSGSILSYSFNEANQQKQVLLIDAEPADAAKRASVKEIFLTRGLSLIKKSFPDLDEAQNWCSLPENKNCWLEIEIFTETPLKPSDVYELKKEHGRIVILKNTLNKTQETYHIEKFSGLSCEDKFKAFYRYKNSGAEPSISIMEAFRTVIEKEIQ